MNRFAVLPLALTLALPLAACSGSNSLNEMDAKLTAKGEADPALTAALEDQIMVDPTLSGQANDHAIRPTAEPYQAPVPAGEGRATPTLAAAANPAQTLGSLAAQQAGIEKDAFNGCGLNVHYSMDYAAKLPADLPLPEAARVTEAAGSDDNGCRLRAVSHSVGAPMAQVANHYANSAARAGYRVSSASEGSGRMVSGKRASDGGAFYVILTPDGAGTSADLVVNNGR